MNFWMVGILPLQYDDQADALVETKLSVEKEWDDTNNYLSLFLLGTLNLV